MPVRHLSAALAALGLAGLLAGCSSPPASEPAERRSTYDCSNNETLELRFQAADRTALLLRKGGQVTLAAEPVASGFRYSNGPITVQGKGADLLIEIGRMVPIRCEARPG
ncbi:MliC family protein [Acidovorax lacteus]|uniref:C-type lysozyme inhibitor domain-containing protein n=1 Tax=Acidovorax lacteus TaxID=1924988 RepID=A0ABP8L4W1_9BURK